ncbi:MAG: low molecular weight protein arginine phosphatase [Bacillota bacterium]
MKNILFICTGNTCRSSMAEGIAKNLLPRKDKEEFLFVSAGVAAAHGAPATPEAIKVMSEKGIDLSTHQATQVTQELIERADLVLAMTRGNKAQILRMVPEAREKVYLLKEYLLDQAQADKKQQRLDQLHQTMVEKRERFWEIHQEEINRLRSEYQELYEKTKKVSREIKAWEERLEQELREETQELFSLQAEADLDIIDPYGAPLEVYRGCARELEESIARILDRLVERRQHG